MLKKEKGNKKKQEKRVWTMCISIVDVDGVRRVRMDRKIPEDINKMTVEQRKTSLWEFVNFCGNVVNAVERQHPVAKDIANMFGLEPDKPSGIVIP